MEEKETIQPIEITWEELQSRDLDRYILVYRQATTNAVAYHILLLFLTYVKRCDKIRLYLLNGELYGRKIYERGTETS